MNFSPTSARVFSVQELNRTVRTLIESDMGIVTLEGEISNFTRPASGHWYLTLKDQHAQIRAAMFKMANRRVAFKPEAGMQVQVRGKVSLYEPRGDYQFIIDFMEEAGAGALQRAFEQLRTKLEAEGLFAAARKTIKPDRISRIGVMTSATGAALQDVLSVIGRRNPLVEVIVYPVPVQGLEAAPAMRAMLDTIESKAEIDALIICRGGGSIEDLFAFNDETLARKIAELPIYTVSGVGHETDFTICDWVADYRAPTPSAAAEWVSNLLSDRLQWLDRLERQLRQQTLSKLQQLALRTDHLEQRLHPQSPQQKLKNGHAQLQSLRQRLALSYQHTLKAHTASLSAQSFRLNAQNPALKLPQLRRQIDLAASSLHRSQIAALNNKQQSLANIAAQLNQLSPLATLSRGFAAVSSEGKTIERAADLSDQQAIQIRFQDGTVDALVSKRD